MGGDGMNRVRSHFGDKSVCFRLDSERFAPLRCAALTRPPVAGGGKSGLKSGRWMGEVDQRE